MKHNISTITTLSLAGITACTGLVLAGSYVSAEDVVDDVSIEVPTSCSMSGSGMNTHTAEVPNGTYQANIGTTTINALCNDNAGFSIYVVGYTGEAIGQTNSNKLVGTNASGNAAIDTGTATTAGNPDVSNWAMKLATDSEATYPLTLSSGYNAYHAVPNEYTKVATRLTGTDTGTGAVGSTLTTTYAAYISKTQAADTYSGKVKYTLVHPNDGAAPTSGPTPPVSCTTPVPNLTYMQDLNSSNKASILSDMTEDAQYYLADKRDDKTYCVAKLKDGNIWMTQNLDHDIVTDGSVTYNNTTTDLGWNGSSYSTASWSPSRATYATGTTTWNGSYSTPESYDPGDVYWNGELNTDYGDSSNYISSTGNSHYHLGNYYNWTAAVAMNDSSSVYELYEEDAGQSICPAGWTLPKFGDETSSGSFQYLVTQYGWDSSANEMANPYIWNSPIKLSLAGYWGGSLDDVGNYGSFWSPVTQDYEIYSFLIDHYGYVGSWDHSGVGGGENVRCVAR